VAIFKGYKTAQKKKKVNYYLTTKLQVKIYSSSRLLITLPEKKNANNNNKIIYIKNLLASHQSGSSPSHKMYLKDRLSGMVHCIFGRLSSTALCYTNLDLNM